MHHRPAIQYTIVLSNPDTEVDSLRRFVSKLSRNQSCDGIIAMPLMIVAAAEGHQLKALDKQPGADLEMGDVNARAMIVTMH